MDLRKGITPGINIAVLAGAIVGAIVYLNYFGKGIDASEEYAKRKEVAEVVKNTRFLMKPTDVYQADLDGDQRSDLVIETIDGHRYVFLQQEDGRYKSLEQIRSETENNLEKLNDTIERRLNDVMINEAMRIEDE